jgi:hypothetical protein
MNYGGFTLTRNSSMSTTVEQTPSGMTDVPAEGYRFEALHPDGHVLELVHLKSGNGERWVECHVIDSPSILVRRVDGRLRLTTTAASHGTRFCELRQARPKGDRWANLYKATLTELDTRAGVKVAEMLRNVGAHEVGTRESLLGHRGPRRDYLCALFDEDNDLLPIVAFLLTRVLPLASHE